MGVIYLITNNINGHRYVGQTSVKLQYRWKQHIYDSNRFKAHLFRAIKKYGHENFTVSVLEEVDNSLLNEKEMNWISKLQPEYNHTPGGNVHLRGMTYKEIHGEEEAVKLSEKRSLSNKRRGPRSTETKIRISESRKEGYKQGRIKPAPPPPTPEHTQILREAASRIVTCLHCKKQINYSNFMRWHGVNCRQAPTQ
mgnify:CR=1 FL=1